MMYLIINAGSSSLKFKIFDGRLSGMGVGLVERIGLKNSFLDWKIGDRAGRIDWPAGMPDHERALVGVFGSIKEAGLDVSGVRAIGHRVVHGGEEFIAPVRMTSAVERKLVALNRLAPLHNPANLAAYRACRKLLPKAEHVACFDTAFYRDLPDYAFTYSLPWDLYAKHGIRKYGFHGLSHEYVASEAARQLKRPLSRLKLITCHLGSGASVTAVRHGRATETTMGFTPLEGLTMSTRCGDIDPAIPLYLIRELKMGEREVDDMLNRESGLLGISGFKDMRDVLSAAGTKIPGYALSGKVSAETKRRAKLAFEVFCYDVARYIAQYAGIMGGCDAVVFTAGIGERSEPVRKRVMSMVTLPNRPKIMVIPTDEELMIARETRRVAG
ncbi:acetate/propionate family kinase [Candidatus Uhrbacteria bacterium]|nr:acetate/propionate family kinase [Candidatus Uhrbacteria bacterium]